jgi:signal peptidase S26 family
MRILLIGLALIVVAQPPAFQRGDLVRVRDVKKPAVVKIVGLPDEIVEANETGVYIDDVAVTGFSKEFLTRNRWARQYIPMDHYFVMGEERVNQDISEHIGIHQAETLQRVQP